MLNPSLLNSGLCKKALSKFSNKKVERTLFWTAIEKERNGVHASEFAANIHKLGITKTRAAQIFKLSRSTLAHKIASNAMLVRTDALAAIRLEKLCSLAEKIVSNSLHIESKGFNAGKWLGVWIELPQPALEGLRPSELLDTEAGASRVIQVLGAIESGAYL